MRYVAVRHPKDGYAVRDNQTDELLPEVYVRAKDAQDEAQRLNDAFNAEWEPEVPDGESPLDEVRAPPPQEWWEDDLVPRDGEQ